MKSIRAVKLHLLRTTRTQNFNGVFQQFSEVGAICREAASECDLPEFCNGSSADCPPDMHKQNGMSCGSKENCYAGKCLNHHQHCTDLFGRGKACLIYCKVLEALTIVDRQRALWVQEFEGEILFHIFGPPHPFLSLELMRELYGVERFHRTKGPKQM